MALRSLRERVLQTLCFEITGLTLAVPVFAIATGSTSRHSMLLITLLSLVALVWTPVHNTLFDLTDFRLSARKASDRPHWLRIGHAISHEVSAVVLTLPIVMSVGRLSFAESLAVNIGLTAFYTAYAYVFHLAYDRLRPVQVPRAKPS
ncbi:MULTISPECIES: PACE efflux transporter [Rhodobacterales]|uniref:PACE efflux transporter n=1 Tax=Rhodobacterales TaxID=204455 RepID=UPI003296A0EF